MPRNYIRKTDRGGMTSDVMERAAQLVIDNPDSKQYSMRQIAKQFNIHYSTLSRYIAKKKKHPNSPKRPTGYAASGWRRVFSEEQERQLAEYLKRCSDIMFGLSPNEVRKLAYECAMFFNINTPDTWKENKSAGPDWFSAFMKRNTDLSIRQPEATSFARCTSFNKQNVAAFFDKLLTVFSRNYIPPSRIFNMDETGVATVLKPRKIVAPKGRKQIGSVTSAERGEMITVSVAVSAVGNAIPPMFIFPRMRFKDHFIRDGPAGCIGVGNKSGWQTEETFIVFLNHFISHTHSIPENPVLLLLDNHSSHISCEGINLCKTNGVILLSFPPHCSHHLQPLDVSVYGPFKMSCEIGINSWLKTHPGKTITIYDLPAIIKQAFLLSMTPSNITSGFKKTGITPFNPQVFTDDDFAPASVTDRPKPVSITNEEPQQVSLSKQAEEDVVNIDYDEPGPSNFIQDDADVEPGSTAGLTQSNASKRIRLIPEAIRPLPKAPPRQKTVTRRRQRKSAILTDTPEKRAIEEEKLKKTAAAEKKSNKSKKSNKVEKKVRQ